MDISQTWGSKVGPRLLWECQIYELSAAAASLQMYLGSLRGK